MYFIQKKVDKKTFLTENIFQTLSFSALYTKTEINAKSSMGGKIVDLLCFNS